MYPRAPVTPRRPPRGGPHGGGPAAAPAELYQWREDDGRLTVTARGYELTVVREGFAFSFRHADGRAAAPAHAEGGLTVSNSAIASFTVRSLEDRLELDAVRANGRPVPITLTPRDHWLRITVRSDEPFARLARFGPLAPGYGLGDHAPATVQRFEVAGMGAHKLTNNGGLRRFVTPFVIYPAQGFAAVAFAPGLNIGFQIRADGHTLTASGTPGAEAHFDYFIGTPTQIYAAYRQARIQEGFPDVRPNPLLFELGWESWDALRWDTNQRTVREHLERFVEAGYPIRWAVTGSGFWADGQTTTSFGMWHPEKYPDPDALRRWMTDHRIAWVLGQRTNFVTPGGPHTETGKTDNNRPLARILTGPLTEEGLAAGYFLTDRDGQPKVFTSAVFPKVPAYLLDGRSSAASAWFAEAFTRWGAAGVKEDTMIAVDDVTIFNGPMVALEQAGVAVMARNGAYSAPGTLLRINDTYLGLIHNRIPINYLAYAASAAPNVYSDTIGWGGMHKDRIGSIRMAWLCALTAGISVGVGPWDWPADDRAALEKAIGFRHALTPYFLSAAMDSYRTGFPHTLTPLPIAFPDDPQTHGLATVDTQVFQWMVGESLLATPLLRRTYPTSDRMRVYLPAGRWIGYDTGVVHEGPRFLEDFEMPRDRVPAFVGGKGVLLERTRAEDQLFAVVYPLATGGSRVQFTHADDAVTTIVNSNTGWNPPTLRVTDGGGRPVRATHDAVTGAFRFPVAPGGTYQLTGGD